MDCLSDLDRTSNKLIIDFGKKMRCLDLEMMGIGGREVGGKVTDLDVSFRAPEVLDLFRARELVIEVVNRFVNEVNSNKDVRKHLLNYPCTPQDLIVGIFSAYEGRQPASIVLVDCRNGSIVYYAEVGSLKPLIEVHSESFEEAVSILSSSKK